MAKKVITGWIGKTTKPRIEEGVKGRYVIAGMYMHKYTKDDWPYDDWPPRKVRITIEEL